MLTCVNKDKQSFIQMLHTFERKTETHGMPKTKTNDNKRNTILCAKQYNKERYILLIFIRNCKSEMITILSNFVAPSTGF